MNQRLVGGGDLPTARRVVGQAVLLGVGFGVLGGVAAELGLPGLFRLLGLPEQEAEYAVRYLRPLAALLPSPGLLPPPPPATNMCAGTSGCWLLLKCSATRASA